MKSDFMLAITQLAAEKKLPKEVILRAVEAALVSAFKKDSFATTQGISVKITPSTGEVRVYVQKNVVDEVTDPRREILLSEAQRVKPDVQIGEVIEVESTPHNAGRIAAQIAKQVILQRLREAERDAIYAEFKEKKGDIVSGVIQRIEPNQIIINLGRAEAILPRSEQVPVERYRVGQKIKVYLMEVGGARGGDSKASLIVSRAHRDLLRRLFELEVPEIYNGVVELKAIAREAGYRSKVAVAARQEGIDPVGCCVGLRGLRIQNITRELNGEKIDVVLWDNDPAVFIANALSPAPVVKVEMTNPEEKTATVIVPDRQLSLAIGREGQNARLAAKLTGWRIDIKSASVAEAERAAKEEAARQEAEIAGFEAAEETIEEAMELVAEEKILPLVETEEPSVPAIEEEAALEPFSEEMETAPVPETPLPLEEIFLEPKIPGEGQRLRFAEDLPLPKSAKPDTWAKKDKKKGISRGGKEEAEGIAKPKKAKRQRVVFLEEEDFEDF